MKSEWCSYPTKSPYGCARDESILLRHGGVDPKRFPRKRMVCPVCKRRLLAKGVFNHDGDFCGYAIPKHKVSKIPPKRPSRKASRARIGRGRG